MSEVQYAGAHIQFRIAHQSLADLEAISPAFERRVRTNTRWKILLHNKDPDHLELVSRSYGTKTTFKRTVRFKQGPLGAKTLFSDSHCHDSTAVDHQQLGRYGAPRRDSHAQFSGYAGLMSPPIRERVCGRVRRQRSSLRGSFEFIISS